MSPELLYDRETLGHIAVGLLAIAAGVLSVLNALTVTTLLTLIGFLAVGVLGYIVGEKNSRERSV